MEDTLFWQRMDRFVSSLEVVIDRPRGSRHPRYNDMIYPHDYGYLKGTQAMDQAGIDVWVGSRPEQGVSAIICTVDLTKNDSEMKILIGCTPDEAETILKFHNDGPMSGILIFRPS